MMGWTIAMIYGLSLGILFAEFSHDVRGEPTIVGCYLRGLHDADDGRCGGKQ